MKRRKWTDEEVALLRAEYPDKRAEDIAVRLGMSVRTVYNKAFKLRLKKSRAFYASPEAHRLDGLKGKGTRFLAGQTPWNAGKKGWTSGGRSFETRFQAGNKPHTWKPVGSYRLTREGLLQQKISDVPGPTFIRWRSVHELVWIEANGPVPPGHLIVFKPGMRTAVPEEITVDRVECISRAENARRNHPMYRDPEYARLVQLKGAITRQVNRITREAKEKP